MYKKIVTIVLSLTITSVLSAQESPQKKVTIGTDLAPLAFTLLNENITAGVGYYGLIHNNGKNEIGVGAFAFVDQENDISGIGFAPGYRFYHSGTGKGIFYEASLGFAFFNWDYTKLSETVTGTIFWPTVNLGYKWSWDFGLTLDPYIGINYGIGKIEASDGTASEAVEGGIGPSFGLGIGYTF